MNSITCFIVTSESLLFIKLTKDILLTCVPNTTLPYIFLRFFEGLSDLEKLKLPYLLNHCTFAHNFYTKLLTLTSSIKQIGLEKLVVREILDHLLLEPLYLVIFMSTFHIPPPLIFDTQPELKK